MTTTAGTSADLSVKTFDFSAVDFKEAAVDALAYGLLAKFYKNASTNASMKSGAAMGVSSIVAQLLSTPVETKFVSIAHNADGKRNMLGSAIEPGLAGLCMHGIKYFMPGEIVSIDVPFSGGTQMSRLGNDLVCAGAIKAFSPSVTSMLVWNKAEASTPSAPNVIP